MIGPFAIHGHAIVSADDRIADASGATPPSLRNEADWRRFQAALDAAALVVVGRHGHALNPNPKRRRRLVLSSAAAGIEARPDGWWWNPAAAPLADALAAAAPAGGTVAVTGGQQVMDLFLAAGFDRFDLARAERVRLGAGPALFSACEAGTPAAAVLAGAGLRPGPAEVLDAAAGVTLTVWAAGGGR